LLLRAAPTAEYHRRAAKNVKVYFVMNNITSEGDFSFLRSFRFDTMCSNWSRKIMLRALLMVTRAAGFPTLFNTIIVLLQSPYCLFL